MHGHHSSSPFAAVPPPPGMDDGHRKGGKGKGKGHFPDPEMEARHAQPDGLIVSNVPPESNTLDVLNRHFRQFGEVLKITVHAAEGRAFVQFADHGAADRACVVTLMNGTEITLAWATRGDKGKGKAKGKGKDRPTHLDRPAEHRVLCSNPQEQKRIDDSKRKRDDIASRRNALLAAYTEQIKSIMSKLTGADVPEAKRELLRSMILQIKEKMNALNSVEGAEEAGKGKSKKSKAPKAAKVTEYDEERGGYTLDLRPKVLRVNLSQGTSQEKIREELSKFGGSEEKILCVHMEGPTEGEGDSKEETALVQFKDRKSAEGVFNHRTELSFVVEWCDKIPPPQAALPAKPDAEAVKEEAEAPPSDSAVVGFKVEEPSLQDLGAAIEVDAAAPSPAAAAAHVPKEAADADAHAAASAPEAAAAPEADASAPEAAAAPEIVADGATPAVVEGEEVAAGAAAEAATEGDFS